MLKVRVIPTLLYKDVGLVKGVGFDSWRRIGTAVPAIRVFNARDVDELVVLDITATSRAAEPDYAAVKQWARDCFVPLAVGGGVRRLDDIRGLLLAGADKVVINNAAFHQPDLIERAAHYFGSQCVVVSVDVRRTREGEYECFRDAGRIGTGKHPVAWCREMEQRGAGEILLTSIERDGTMNGYDLELLSQVTQAVSIPVIASGGAGGYEHMYDALTVGGAAAVAAGSMFQFTEQTPLQAKVFLGGRGIPVRGAGMSVTPTRAGNMGTE